MNVFKWPPTLFPVILLLVLLGACTEPNEPTSTTIQLSNWYPETNIAETQLDDTSKLTQRESVLDALSNSIESMAIQEVSQDEERKEQSQKLASSKPAEPELLLNVPTAIPPTPTVDPSIPALNRTTNILILGSDRRPNMPNWRTDVIMIVSLDLALNRAAIVSIPRDVYLEHIPRHLPNRINVVDYLGEQDEPDGGGPSLLMQILQDKLNIPIHHYLRFEFSSFKEVVDALGGVEVDVDCRIYEPGLFLPAGQQHLDGEQALAYVRMRQNGGDLERSRRQQRFIWAVLNQMRTQNLLPRVPALYAALIDSIQTDIGIVNAIRFARFGLELDTQKIHGLLISPPDLIQQGWRRGMFVFVADWDAIAEAIQLVFKRPPFLQTNTVGQDGDRVWCPG